MATVLWAYPWDFLDAGIDRTLDRIAESGVEGVSLASAYHNVRAICPHNPRRAVYHGEGGVIYFRPDPDRFSEDSLRPVVSELVGEDPVVHVAKACSERGLKFHSWLVLNHNTRLGTAHPEATITNAFGDHYPFGLCPANPEVRAYVAGIVQSAAQIPGVNVLELEALGYMGLDHSGHHAKSGVTLDTAHKYLLSVCFCRHCVARMEMYDFDVSRAQATIVKELRHTMSGLFRASSTDPIEVIHDLLGPETASGILAARDEVVISLMEDLYWEVQKPQELSVMIDSSPLSTGAGAGVTLSEARQWTDRLLLQAFGSEPEAIQQSVADVAIRRGSTPLQVGIQALSPFVNTEGELVESVRSATHSGADGISFYHYGLMPLERLTWLRSALSEV